jgi:hypothetical protein
MKAIKLLQGNAASPDVHDCAFDLLYAMPLANDVLQDRFAAGLATDLDVGAFDETSASTISGVRFGDRRFPSR